MDIAYTMAPGRGDTDLLMARLAEQLRARGIRTCGIVQTNTEVDGGGPCDMDVKVLPDGPVIRISQSLGKDSHGCRLDPDALERAVGLVGASFAAGADLLIVNKFGKHEADGRGFREVIAEAVAADVPVLVGLNPLNRPAFLAFTGEGATQLPPSYDALAGWLEQKVGRLERAEAG